MKITPQFLFAIAPGASGAIVSAIVDNQSILTKYGITDPKEVAWFFGQSACETQGFNRLEENLYYTSTARLRRIWPARFPSDAAAQPFVRNPEALANKVYGGRFGNVQPGDGWRYRGSGLGQTTFYDNYRAVGLMYAEHPDYLRKFPTALEAFCVYWQDHKCAAYVINDNLPGLTKAIQGGSLGLADRQKFTERAMNFLHSPTSQVVPMENSTWLRNGSKGQYVLLVQQQLQAHGFYVGGLLDGKFGDGTELAVVEFQKAAGLIADGVVGEKTLAALNAAPAAPQPTVEAPAPVPAPLPGASAPTGLAGLLAALIAFLASLFGRGKKNG
jgi:putative chitinase